jgi:NAD(P)-dependent dehydrogenase (short-subunit alcohol dehydrogenase family)
MSTLDGKVAIITGGAGGLGAAVVTTFLGAGARVIVPVEKDSDLDTLRERAHIPASAPLGGARLELTDEAAVRAYYTRVAREHGGLDILVNLAGGFAGGQPMHETPWSLWQQQIDVNLKTAVLSCAAAVPHLLARGGGAIVNVGTRTATQPAASLAAYAASKRAVLQLTEALAAELRDGNVTANAILPSVIDTPANRRGNPDEDYSRWVKPAEIARVILFLVGPDARVISGAAIPVYGRA